MPENPASKLFHDRDAIATALVAAALEPLGRDFLFGNKEKKIDPAGAEAIMRELADAFGTDVPQANLNKFMAALTILRTDHFYKSLPDFVELCNALFDGSFDPDTWDPADALEISWGITEAMLLWPPDPEDQTPFDEQIVGYVAKVVAAEGILRPRDVLRLGFVDRGDWQRVQAEYADAPETLAQIQQIEREKSDEIEQFVRTRFRLLVRQLQEIGKSDVLDGLRGRRAS